MTEEMENKNSRENDESVDSPVTIDNGQGNADGGLAAGQAQEPASFNDAGSPEAIIAQLQEKLAEAEKEVLRVQADMENYRKRTRRDLQDQLKYANLPLVTEIVGAVDNLQRAIETANTNQSTEGLVEGVSMVATQLCELLDQNGCQKISALGEAFDPNVHEAIQMQPSDQYEANQVSQEIRTGYRLHERVVRPAQVFVSTGPAPE